MKLDADPSITSSTNDDDNQSQVTTGHTESTVTATDDSSIETSISEGGKIDEEDDRFYQPPAGALAAPNLLCRSLAILLSSESHVDPSLLSSIINADTSAAVSPWNEKLNKIQDLEGRKVVRKAMRRADEAAEMMLACSDRVSRKVRDAARRRILIKREEEAERRREVASTGKQRGVSPAKKGSPNDEGGQAVAYNGHSALEDEQHQQDKRCKLLFVPLCLYVVECGLLEVYISASKASQYSTDIVSAGLPMLAKVLYGVSLSHNKMILTR